MAREYSTCHDSVLSMGERVDLGAQAGHQLEDQRVELAEGTGLDL